MLPMCFRSDRSSQIWYWQNLYVWSDCFGNASATQQEFTGTVPYSLLCRDINAYLALSFNTGILLVPYTNWTYLHGKALREARNLEICPINV